MAAGETRLALHEALDRPARCGAGKGKGGKAACDGAAERE